ncbi:hypothetical protein Tco_0155082 [Tanacetum coccineum]
MKNATQLQTMVSQWALGSKFRQKKKVLVVEILTEKLPECEIYGSYDHSTSGHNRVIQIRGGVLAESSQSNESSIRVKDTSGSLSGTCCDNMIAQSSLIPLSRGSFDVIVGMDWLSKRKFVMVCYEKVVRIPLEGDEILRVHGERTQGVVKTLMNTKVDELKLSDISVERVKPRRVRAMAMTIQYGVRGMILAAQSEAFKEENVAILWAEMKKSSLIGPELVQETTDKVRFEVGDQVMLKVSPWKGVIHFGKKVKLAPSGVHDTFHVLNLKKCWADASLHVRMDEIKVDKTLRFVEEPAEITDYEVKRLKRSRISLVKVYWNSKRGPEFTWEREDHMKSKYPQLFVDRAVESTS